MKRKKKRIGRKSLEKWEIERGKLMIWMIEGIEEMEKGEGMKIGGWIGWLDNSNWNKIII